VSASSKKEPTRVLMDLRCNNACRFCDQGDKDPRAVSKDELLGRVSAVADGGEKALTFCGGEATLDLALLEAAAAHARGLGMKDVGVHTNGRMLAYPGAAERLQEAGVSRFDVSLHGAEELAHDWVTRTAGSFFHTMAGLRRLVRLRARLRLHMVLVRSNYRQAPQVAALAGRARAKELHLRFAVAEGWAAHPDAMASLVPRFVVVTPHLEEAQKAARATGVSLRLHDLPDCMAGGLRKRLVREQPTWIGAKEAGWRRPKPVFPEICGECCARARCCGLAAPYVERYGTDELSSLTRSGSRAARNRRIKDRA
jgi:pyruvate-formate lyase-activating enzyme